MATAVELPRSRGTRFVVNVIWNWAAVAISLVTGFLLSPYLIRKLGPEGYGIWALSFSLVEYYWLLDLGFRSATVKFVAHYTATEEPSKVAEVISTAFVYACIAAGLILTIVTLASPHIQGFFRISEQYRDSFSTLLMVMTLSWCLGMVFNLYGAALEARHRFDLTNRVAIVTTGLRAVAWTVLLYLGYGLIPIGIATVLTQCLSYGLNYYYFRTVFRSRQISYRRATLPMLKQMASFGIHTFMQTMSQQALNQGPPVVIGHFLPTAFVGFFNLPVRLLQYTVDFVGRIGVVTNINAAELAARQESKLLAQLAIYANRYCLVIFMPMAILLATHGGQFFQFWVGAEVARESAPLLPILLIGYVFAVVGQFSSSMLLLGLGKHQRYAKGLVAEALVTMAALWLVVPRWGIIGAAWIASVMMVLNRGIFAPWLVTRTLSLPFGQYMAAVYARPLLAAVPAIAFAYGLRATALPGANWAQIFASALAIGTVYYALAVFVCFDREHRSLLWEWVGRKFARARVTTAG